CWSCSRPGQFALAVHTDRPRLFSKIWSIPDVRQHQTGDREMRAVFPVEALEQVAAVTRVRKTPGVTSAIAKKIGSTPAFEATSRSQHGEPEEPRQWRHRKRSHPRPPPEPQGRSQLSGHFALDNPRSRGQRGPETRHRASPERHGTAEAALRQG